jgi:hypothetical protein
LCASGIDKYSSLNDGDSYYVSATLEIYMTPENKNQPQQGGEGNKSGQQGQQQAAKNPGQQASEKAGQTPARADFERNPAPWRGSLLMPL